MSTRPRLWAGSSAARTTARPPMMVKDKRRAAVAATGCPTAHEPQDDVNRPRRHESFRARLRQLRQRPAALNLHCGVTRQPHRTARLRGRAPRSDEASGHSGLPLAPLLSGEASPARLPAACGIRRQPDDGTGRAGSPCGWWEAGCGSLGLWSSSSWVIASASRGLAKW